MTRVYIASAKPEESSALRLLLLDLKMEVVGEAADSTAIQRDMYQICVAQSLHLIIRQSLGKG